MCWCGRSALDEMGSRIDELEKSIADLMEQNQTTERGGEKGHEHMTSEASAVEDKSESV